VSKAEPKKRHTFDSARNGRSFRERVTFEALASNAGTPYAPTQRCRWGCYWAASGAGGGTRTDWHGGRGLGLYNVSQDFWVHTLGHTATHYNTLQHTATHYNTLQHTATHCNTMGHTATHCYTLLHTATHCYTRQHTPTYCITLQHTATHIRHSADISLSSHTTIHCNTLQFFGIAPEK